MKKTFARQFHSHWRW